MEQRHFVALTVNIYHIMDVSQEGLEEVRRGIEAYLMEQCPLGLEGDIDVQIESHSGVCKCEVKHGE